MEDEIESRGDTPASAGKRSQWRTSLGGGSPDARGAVTSGTKCEQPPLSPRGRGFLARLVLEACSEMGSNARKVTITKSNMAAFLPPEGEGGRGTEEGRSDFFFGQRHFGVLFTRHVRMGTSNLRICSVRVVGVCFRYRVCFLVAGKKEEQKHSRMMSKTLFAFLYMFRVHRLGGFFLAHCLDEK